MANLQCHPDDIRSFPKSSGWHNVSWSLCHPDEKAPSRISSGWLMTNAGYHPDDLSCCPICHPDEITKIWSLSPPDDIAIPSISSGCLIVDALCHPDDVPGVGISSGWVTANSLCHQDDIFFHFMSSGWLNWGWFLIRMSYGNVVMSSGLDTLPFLSHPDEIANFDFPQHAVALQRFRTGHDGISVKLLMYSSPETRDPLILINNQSMLTGIFPGKLKIAKVIPLFTKDDRLNMDNYRLISILPAISKIFQRVVYNQLYEYFSSNKLFYEGQYGFRGDHSIELANIDLTGRMISAFDEKSCHWQFLWTYPRLSIP